MKSKLYHKFKQKMQDNRGFTMAEVLTVVAILSILMAITFVAIFHYYQTLKLNEMDGTAKEIYIAAQNHLSYAKSTGQLDNLVKSAQNDNKWKTYLGEKVTEQPSDCSDKKWETQDGNLRYIIVNNSDVESGRSVWKSILPNGSIDETVRTGHYIIEYNYKTAKVYGVFYSEKVAFLSDDEDKNSLNQTGEDTRVRPNSESNGHTGRINYGKNNQATHEEYKPGLINGIIGYYGGSNINLPTGKVIDGITLSLKNDNKLTAEIRVPNYFDVDKNKGVNYQYELHVRGKTSGVTRTFLLQVSTENTKDNIKLSSGDKEESYNLYHNITMLKADNDDLVIDFYLDDITKEGAHFSELGRGWIPGEDITAWVDVSGRSKGFGTAGKVGVITGIKRVAADQSVNSLFDYVKVNNSDKTAEVGIANFRNLENLDKQVSNLGMKYDAENPYSQYLSYAINAKPKAVDYDITSAVQTKDLNWDDDGDNDAFLQWIRKSDDAIEQNLKDHKTIDDNIHVVDYDYQDVMSDGEKTTDTPGEHYNRTTKNQYRSINLTKNATIKKKYGNGEEDETYSSALKLYDGGNKEIKNLAITGENEIKENNNSPTSENHPAGLFGTVDLNGDFAVKNLTLVDTNIAAQSTAGALIGKSDNTTLTVENVSAQSKNKSIESSNAVAGGLIGAVNSNNINVHDSFSTMIVKGKTYAGGLIGEAHGNGNISNSYVGGHTDNGKYSTTNYNITATGDNGIAAGFIASADNQLEIQNCYSTASAKGKSKAYAFTNRNLPDSCYAVGKYQVGNDEVKQDTVDEKFVVNDSTARTYHYDSIRENYPYKTVTTGKVDNDIYDHVGDWEVKKEEAHKNTFYRDFAILYYELVQDNANDDTKGYYHGYASDLTDPQQENATVRQVYTSGTRTKDDKADADGYHNGLSIKHNQFVAEDGYLLCVDKKYTTDQVTVGLKGYNNASTLKTMLQKGEITRYDDGKIDRKLGLQGYNLYLINKSVQANEKYATVWRFNTKNESYANDFNKWQNMGTFSFNPCFADTVKQITTGNTTSDDDLNKSMENQKTFAIRSAQQLSYFFDKLQGGNYIGAWNANKIVQQQMDISYDKSDVNLTEAGKELGNSAYQSPTLSQLAGTYESIRPFDVKKDNSVGNNDQLYAFDDLNQTLFTTINGGKLQNVYVKEYNPASGNKRLIDNNQGIISNVTVDSSTGAFTRNMQGTMTDVHVKKFNITHQMDSILAESMPTNSSKIKNVTIDNIKVSAKVGKENMDSGIVGNNNGGTIDSLTVNRISTASVEDNEKPKFIGSNWGIVGKNTGTVSNLSVDNVAINEADATGVTGNFGILVGDNTGTLTLKANALSNITLINTIFSNSSNGKIGVVGYNNHNVSNVTANNIKLTGLKVVENGSEKDADYAFIGNNNAAVNNINLTNINMGDDGFVDINGSGGNISNCNIINASIGKNGFVGENNNQGKISDCQIYSDVQKLPNTVSKNNIKPYELVVVGTDKTEKNTAGFVGINTNGASIDRCSFTGTVFGKQTAGFFGKTEKQANITNSYANAIVNAHSTSGYAAGFGLQIDSDYNTNIQSNHALGIVKNTVYNEDTQKNEPVGKGSGFIGIAQNAQNQQTNNALILNNYTTVWNASTKNYYYFADVLDKQLSRCSGNYYMVNKALKDLNGTQAQQSNNGQSGQGVLGMSGSQLYQLWKNNIQTDGQYTVKYGQFNVDENDKIYPYLMPKNMIAYGDWKEIETDSLETPNSTKKTYSAQMSNDKLTIKTPNSTFSAPISDATNVMNLKGGTLYIKNNVLYYVVNDVNLDTSNPIETRVTQGYNSGIIGPIRLDKIYSEETDFNNNDRKEGTLYITKEGKIYLLKQSGGDDWIKRPEENAGIWEDITSLFQKNS